jgi:cation:H+ antiporter
MSYTLALLIPISLLLTYKGAGQTFKGALGLSTVLRFSRSAAGAVVVATITALPELSSSVAAVVMGSSRLAFGNILGSNIFNLPILIGIAGLFGEFEISNDIAEQSQFLVALNILIALTSLVTGGLSQVIGVLLLSLYIVFLYRSLHAGSQTNDDEACSLGESISSLIIGGAVLLLGSLLLVMTASSLMTMYALNAFFVGIVMSFGAILPEIAVSMFSAFSGEHDISVGSILGDNIITATLVLGIIAILQPITVETRDIAMTIPFTVMFTALMYVMHTKGWKVTRKVSLLMLVSSFIILLAQTLL